MKRVLVSMVCLLTFAPLAAYPFELSFRLAMCTMDESTLRGEVDDLIGKWRQTQRINTPKSQYYKHVKRHVREAVAIIDDAAEQSACSGDRVVVLRRMQDELAATL